MHSRQWLVGSEDAAPTLRRMSLRPRPPAWGRISSWTTAGSRRRCRASLCGRPRPTSRRQRIRSNRSPCRNIVVAAVRWFCGHNSRSRFDLRAEPMDSSPMLDQGPDNVTKCHTGREFCRRSIRKGNKSALRLDQGPDNVTSSLWRPLQRMKRPWRPETGC